MLSAPTSILNTLAPSSSSSSSKTNIGGIVGGVVGVLVVLIVGIFVVHQCSRPSDEVAARARDAIHLEAGVIQPYHDEMIQDNPVFNEAEYATIDEDYEEADPNRPKVYDDGFIAGAASHALRDSRRQSQISTEDDEDNNTNV